MGSTFHKKQPAFNLRGRNLLYPAAPQARAGTSAPDGEPMSRDITEALRAMGYTDSRVPALAEPIPPGVIDHLRDFRMQEIRDILETLLYIYIAQEQFVTPGEGRAWSNRSQLRVYIGAARCTQRGRSHRLRIQARHNDHQDDPGGRRSPGRSWRPDSRRSMSWAWRAKSMKLSHPPCGDRERAIRQ